MSATNFKKGRISKVSKETTSLNPEEAHINVVPSQNVDEAHNTPQKVPSALDSSIQSPTLTEESKVDPINSEELVDGEYTEERIQEYYEFLKTKGIADADLVATLDTIVTSGTVRWQFKLFDKVDVIMVMRPAWVNAFILRQIEELSPKTYSRFTDIVSVYNLAGSLSQYGDKTFTLVDESDVIINYDKINSMGFVIQNKLVQQLAIFDRVLAVATSDWAIENFTEPQLAD